MLYRLFTEDIMGTEEIAGRFFDGFTVIKGTGYWKGDKEKSLCIEIVVESGAEATTEMLLHELVETINKQNNQECCLLQKIKCESEFI